MPKLILKEGSRFTVAGTGYSYEVILINDYCILVERHQISGRGKGYKDTFENYDVIGLTPRTAKDKKLIYPIDASFYSLKEKWLWRIYRQYDWDLKEYTKDSVKAFKVFNNITKEIKESKDG